MLAFLFMSHTAGGWFVRVRDVNAELVRDLLGLRLCGRGDPCATWYQDSG
jgi:hypothetical protein